MYKFLKKYKYWFAAISFLVLLQIAMFYINAQYSAMMNENRLQSLALKINNEIKQSIVDKQKATLAIAFTLGHDVSNLEFTAQNFAHNVKFNGLITKISKHSAYQNFRVQIVNKGGQTIYRSWSSFHNYLSKLHPEFKLALQKGEAINSISSGMFGVVLKTITPIVQNNKTVGFLDVVSEFNSIQRNLESNQIDSLVVATAKRSKVIEVPFSPNKIGSFYVSNLKPNVSLMKNLNESLMQNWQNRPDFYWLWQGKLVVKYPLKSVDNKTIAYLFAVSSVAELTSKTESYAELLNTKNSIIMASVIITIVLLMGMALILVRYQKQYYQDVFNYQEEAVLVTNGKNCLDANDQLLYYFPVLKEDNFACICHFFEEEDGFLQKYMDGVLWIDYLIENMQKDTKAQITHNGQKVIFQVKGRRLKQTVSDYVVVLTNITKIETLNRQLKQQSLIDDLTQAGNRRNFNETITREIELSKRNGLTFALISFDIDHFKKVNDTYGHAEGDLVLKHVVQATRSVLRSTDALFRIGGEEFIALLSMQGNREAVIVAEKIRLKIASTQVDKVGHVTASFGVTEMNDEDDQESLLIRVDQAMYQAKENGRNRITVI